MCVVANAELGRAVEKGNPPTWGGREEYDIIGHDDGLVNEWT